MIAAALKKEVSIKSPLPSEKHRWTEGHRITDSISILDLTFSDFFKLREKLSIVQKYLSEEHDNTEKLNLGITLANELDEEVKKIAQEIDLAVKRCLHMMENLEDEPTPQFRVAFPERHELPSHDVFHINCKKDIRYAIKKLKQGRKTLDEKFISATNLDQPYYMQVPDLIKRFNELINESIEGKTMPSIEISPDSVESTS